MSKKKKIQLRVIYDKSLVPKNPAECLNRLLLDNLKVTMEEK